MAIIAGLDPSFTHPQNGMILSDMEAALAVSRKLEEVIIFRSTGPWSKRWLGFDPPYPSKSFHAKGKSSDWGPHAGLVPRDGVWSKVGADERKARKGTGDNAKGLLSKFIGEAPLVLTLAQLRRQVEEPEGDPPRHAVEKMRDIDGSPDKLLLALRSGDKRPAVFRAKKNGAADSYTVCAYPFERVPKEHAGGHDGILDAVFEADREGRACEPLLVMTSREVGADNRPMTGDYDLWAVCPKWRDYGNTSITPIVKPAIELEEAPEHRPQALRFEAGVGMDNVLDTRNHTGGTLAWHDFRTRLAGYRTSLTTKNIAWSEASLELITRVNAFVGNADEGEEDYVGLEHNEMGNLSPRVLRAIVELNKAMGADDQTRAGALRRVHHNAEVARNRLWFALTAEDMITKKDGEQFGDGFPLTGFQPRDLERHDATRAYGAVFTLETRDDFRAYAAALKTAGYFVPKSWVWEMSVSDVELERRKAARAIEQRRAKGEIDDATARALIAALH